MTNKYLCVLLIFIIVGCSKEKTYSSVSCDIAKKTELAFSKNPTLQSKKNEMSYYLEHKGACELENGERSGYDTLAESARLGSKNALFLLSYNRLLKEGDLEQVSVLKELSFSKYPTLSMDASFFLGAFLLLDERARLLEDFQGNKTIDFGLSLIKRSSGSNYAYLTHYLRAILRVENLNDEERQMLRTKGDELQIRSLGSIQEGCSQIFDYVSIFKIDESRIYNYCP